MAPEFQVELRSLFFHVVVSVRLAPARHRFQASPIPLAHRAQMDREEPSAAPGTEMREPQEAHARSLISLA
jgi:hypothetical protein